MATLRRQATAATGVGGASLREYDGWVRSFASLEQNIPTRSLSVALASILLIPVPLWPPSHWHKHLIPSCASGVPGGAVTFAKGKSDWFSYIPLTFISASHQLVTAQRESYRHSSPRALACTGEWVVGVYVCVYSYFIFKCLFYIAIITGIVKLMISFIYLSVCIYVWFLPFNFFPITIRTYYLDTMPLYKTQK